MVENYLVNSLTSNQYWTYVKQWIAVTVNIDTKCVLTQPIETVPNATHFYLYIWHVCWTYLSHAWDSCAYIVINANLQGNCSSFLENVMICLRSVHLYLIRLGYNFHNFILICIILRKHICDCFHSLVCFFGFLVRNCVPVLFLLLKGATYSDIETVLMIVYTLLLGKLQNLLYMHIKHTYTCVHFNNIITNWFQKTRFSHWRYHWTPRLYKKTNANK